MSENIRCYRILRFRFKGPTTTVRNNVTLAEAQAHCKRADTHGPGWFDGYDYMKGIPDEETIRPSNP
jgi:hypothetical protein